MSNEPTEINGIGDKFWLNSEGQLHRDNDLPAVITLNGYHAWWQNGKCHRDNDLPAVIDINGYCVWYQHDGKIKEKYCTKKEIEEYKKPHYFQKVKNIKFDIKFDRFEKLIK